MKSSGDNNYCKLFALHAELNSLEADNLPEICRGLAIRYIKEGQFARDLNLSIQIVESYFSTLTPSYNGLDVVLMDIDDIFASSSKYSNLLIDRYFLVPVAYLLSLCMLPLIFLVWLGS